MKGVNIFLADGFEDVEALAVNDVLRRGGVEVTLVSVGDAADVRSSHGVSVCADALLSSLDLSADGVTASDVMIFPGGMPGSKNLASHNVLMDAMRAHYAAGGCVAAICAAPGLVLGQLGADVLEGAEFTCFDGFETLPQQNGAVFVPRPAVRSGRMISGRSAGYAIPFGLEILRVLRGDEVAEKVSAAMFLETV